MAATYTITLIDQASAAANRVRTALARVAVTTNATAVAMARGSKAEQAFARDAERLARTQLRVMLEELLPRMPNLRIQPGATIENLPGATLMLKALPLEWSPA